MKQANAQTLSGVIGRRIRDVRESTELKQDDLARAARECGLAWTRATVAAVELGRRELRSGELVLLPFVLAQAGIEKQLADLLPGDDTSKVAVTPETHVTVGALRRILTGHAYEARAEEVDDPHSRKFFSELHRTKIAAPHLEKEEEAIRKHFGIGFFKTQNSIKARKEAREDAEQKVAWKLKVPALAVALAARQLWNVSMSDERERRLRSRATKGLDRRGLQALRGHVTRELLAELAPLLEGLSSTQEKLRGRASRRREKGGHS